MGLDLWYKEDVARILAATHETMQATSRATPAASPELAGTYQQGFADALRVVAVAFGLGTPIEFGSRSEQGQQQRWEESVIDVGTSRHWPSSNGRGR